MSALLFVAFAAGLFVGVPVTLWRLTWREAVDLWAPREAGTEHVTAGSYRDAEVTRFEAGPPVEVRLAALGSWILGVMFVPGLLLGLVGLLAMGVGLVSIPGLYLAARLFLLGAPLLRGDGDAPGRARSAAVFARWLNYVVLALCAVTVLSQAPTVVRYGLFWGDSFNVIALALGVALYAGVSLAHARLLDRAADHVDAEQERRLARLTGVRIDENLVGAEPEEAAAPASIAEARRAGREP